MVVDKQTTGRPVYPSLHFDKREWCHTREEAVGQAHEMRVKKIQSLKKQVIKLESMTF